MNTENIGDYVKVTLKNQVYDTLIYYFRKDAWEFLTTKERELQNALSLQYPKIVQYADTLVIRHSRQKITVIKLRPFYSIDELIDNFYENYQDPTLNAESDEKT